MLGAIARHLFGTANDRMLKKLAPLVVSINSLEDQFAVLSDEDLRAQTQILRDRLASGETENDILPEAFAITREAAKRVLGQRHFDVQLLGGMVLHKGMIAEMRTGEGKTLVATLPVFLNALSGKGVHVVTVNDYLARRDSQWMGQVYRFLGMSVGCIMHDMTDLERKEAYNSDITYGTNNEFGFDYLRDNMKFSHEDMVQRPFHFAIVDEVDSILIDEARTPLIISGPTEDNSELYRRVDEIIPLLDEVDFEKDDKTRGISLTEIGTEHVELLLRVKNLLLSENLYDLQNINLIHHVNQSLRAHKTFNKDVDYIVRDNKVIIIDEFTGRMMEGRRYSDGLHQALEAKEKVAIQNENQTLASITFQNYFRLYPKLGGMTGTAMTEASEFLDIYSLEVVEIPTNRQVQRSDHNDEVYRTAEEKYEAIISLVAECRQRKQPVLVGTVSIEKSEMLSAMLKKRKIPHEVLNARHHEREAYIVSQAGIPGAVTIATNMAGRGTDIQLGGNLEMRILHELSAVEDEKARLTGIEKIKKDIENNRKIVLEAGGLYIVGTERHESRRIDNQLRGRAGRQGDPGASKFYLSLEDDLMRIFGSERMDGLLQKLGLRQGEAIIHPWINKAIEKAQQKVEQRNFDSRKNILKFDDVMNDQRKVIYEQRKELMGDVDVSETISDMRYELLEELIVRSIPENALPEQWDIKGLHEDTLRLFGLDLPLTAWASEEGIAEAEIHQRIKEKIDQVHQDKIDQYGEVLMRKIGSAVLLETLDRVWKNHLLTLDHLRQGIYLRAFGQKDPLNEYKREAFTLFQEMLNLLREQVVSLISHVRLEFNGEPSSVLRRHPPIQFSEGHIDPALQAIETQPAENNKQSQQTVKKLAFNENNPETWKQVPRNAPCPCRSGKKYKHCHGAL
jgi:preprotein translocase subunit SecA